MTALKVEAVWPDDTLVDFDHGLNTAIKEVKVLAEIRNGRMALAMPVDARAALTTGEKLLLS